MIENRSVDSLALCPGQAAVQVDFIYAGDLQIATQSSAKASQKISFVEAAVPRIIHAALTSPVHSGKQLLVCFHRRRFLPPMTGPGAFESPQKLVFDQATRTVEPAPTRLLSQSASTKWKPVKAEFSCPIR
jgi:hypothetical protein